MHRRIKELIKGLQPPRAVLGLFVWGLVGVAIGLAAADAFPYRAQTRALTARINTLSGPPIAAISPPAKRPPSSTVSTDVRPVYCAGADKPYVALTFDDGPGPLTQRTIDELRAAGQRATFFLIGRNTPPQQQVVKNELTVAAVEDHSWNHPFLARIPPSRLPEELGRTQTFLQQVTDQPVNLIRPPYGSYNQTVIQQAQSLGMQLVLWNVDSRDSEGARADQIAKNAIGGLRPGSIILLHENRPQTQMALPRVLQALKQRGLTSVSIPELLRLDPPSNAQLARGPGSCYAPSPAPREGQGE